HHIFLPYARVMPKKHSSVADPPPPSPPDPHFKGRFSPGGEARAVQTAPEGPPATKSACADCPDPAWHRGLLIKKTTLVRGLGEKAIPRQLCAFLAQISPLQENFRSATISGRPAKKRASIGATRHNIHRIPQGIAYGSHTKGESVASREFTVADEYVYKRSGPVRWVISHVLRYKRFLLGAF